jgi:hypothetical protein
MILSGQAKCPKDIDCTSLDANVDNTGGISDGIQCTYEGGRINYI